MRRIIRQIFNTDFDGNVLSTRSEQLTDDEAGTIEENCVTKISRCQACGRPIEKTNEIRGTCIICGRSCCSICEGYCAICRCGPLCGQCRTGFAEKGLSVCSNCLPALEERMAYHDRILEQKAIFEREVAICNAYLKLIQTLHYNKGKVSRTVMRIAQFRTARKIAKLEKQFRQENNRGRQLLP